MVLTGESSRGRLVAALLAVLAPAVLAVTGSGPTALAAPTDSYVAVGAAAGTEGLDPALALAYTLAEDAAHAEGVPLWINSGYRTEAEQRALWDDGIATYGSPDAARRWVLPPEESSHVAGRAIDVGPQDGARWLEANGDRWGLCRTYENEWWHFEQATVPGGACPPLRSDASER